MSIFIIVSLIKMSVNNLLIPNNYDIFSHSLTTSNSISAPTINASTSLTTPSIITPNILTTDITVTDAVTTNNITISGTTNTNNINSSGLITANNLTTTGTVNSTNIVSSGQITANSISSIGNISNSGTISANIINTTQLTTGTFSRTPVNGYNVPMPYNLFSPYSSIGTCTLGSITSNIIIAGGWTVQSGGTTTFSGVAPIISNITTPVVPNMTLNSITVWWQGNIGSLSSINIGSALAQSSAISIVVANTSSPLLNTGSGTHIHKTNVNVPFTLADSTFLYINILFSVAAIDTTFYGAFLNISS